MGWKRLAAIGVVVLLAAYAGGRLAAPDGGGLALAAGGGSADLDKNLAVATLLAPGVDANKLIVADTAAKRLAVYKVGARGLRLVALRCYLYDMQLEDSAELPKAEPGYEEVRDAVLRAGEDKKLLRGRELLITTDADSKGDGNRIILVNPDEKRMVVYRLDGNSLALVAARHYDADLVQEAIKNVPAPGLTLKDVENLNQPAK